MSATLGGLLKDLRTQRNISQLEVAFALGWKEPSRLSRIEQGKNTTPPRFLIENIMHAMKLSEEEKNQVLLSGNYLPTEEDIENIKKTVAPIADEWQYPAMVIDYSWRIIYTNKKMNKTFNLSKDAEALIQQYHPNVLEIIFSPDFFLNNVETKEEEHQRHEFLLKVLLYFKYVQAKRTREKWYQDLIKRMMANRLFREIWSSILSTDLNSFNNNSFLTKSFTKKEKNGRKTQFKFHYFLEPVFNDPRFLIDYHVPADVKTLEYFEKTK